MKSKIKVLVFKEGQVGTVTEIDNDLDAMHDIVGGYIEALPLNANGLTLVCDEEGKLKCKRPNRFINGQWIVGTFFICGTKGSNFASITEKQIKEVKMKW